MASRKEQKEALRQERQQREQQAAAAAARKRLVGIVVGVLLGAAAIAAIVLVLMSGGDDSGGGGEGDMFPSGGQVPAQQESDLKKAVTDAGCKTVDAKSEGQDHVTDPVTYKSNPPHSGNHHPEPAEDNLYQEDPGVEHSVHALEHGRVVIWVPRTLPEKDRANLRALYDEDPPGMLLVPAPEGMPFQVAASAWTHVLGCERMGDNVFDAIRAFKDTYRGRGPEPVPF